MKIYQKIKRHFGRIAKHPMAHKHPYRALLRYIYFNIKSSIVKEQTINWIEKMKFYARKGDAGLVGNIYYGLYEFEESLFLLHFMRKNDLFLDVGANLGHYSMLVSGIKKCKSIALEPVPATFKQLVRNIELNNLRGLIEPIQMRVADRKDTLYFSSDRNTMDRIVEATYSKAVKVPVVTIDSISKDNPTAIKLDVEGYEYFALIGAKNILKSAELKIVILELNQSEKKYGIEDNTIYQILLAHGFAPFQYNIHNRQLVPLDSYNRDKFNTIFIKDGPFVQKRLLEAEEIKIWNEKF